MARLAILAAGVLTGQTAPQDAPLRPIGPWVAQFEEAMCVLSRGYGGGGKLEYHLALRPVPTDAHIEVALMIPNPRGDFYRMGKATLELLPSGQKVEVGYRDYTIAKGAKRLVRLFVHRPEISDLTTAKSLKLSVGKERPFHMALSNTSKAMETIQGCEDEMVRRWGFDPAALRGITRPAEAIGSPADWVRSDDYPASARRRRLTGAVRVRYTIDVDGRVQGCTMVQSSGVPELDGAACAALAKRGRYKPALGPDGRPTPALGAQTVLWLMPWG